VNRRHSYAIEQASKTAQVAWNCARARRLLLFNLAVSLEWDARKDAPFLSQLEFDLKPASELLYGRWMAASAQP
jgi:hypothetical protein